MNELSQNIKGLLKELKGKPCHYVTHFIKNITGEGGKMVDGLERIISVFEKDKQIAVKNTKCQYGIGGMLVGSAVTAVIMGSAWRQFRKKERKKHEDECNNIISVLRTEVEVAQKGIGIAMESENMIYEDSEEVGINK